MKKILLVVIVACMALVAVPGTANALGVWDIEADYVGTNPSGQWSYLLAPIANRDTTSLLSDYLSGLTTWNPSLAAGGWSQSPAWGHAYYIFNEAAVPEQWWSSVPEAIPVGAAFGYPSSAESLNFRWTAPSAMTVDISFDLTWLQNHAGANGVDWFLDKNDAAGNLASGSYSGLVAKLVPMGVQTVLGVSVLGGDVINFTVDPQGIGSSDGVYADITVTEVPEPTTLAMLASLLIGVGLLWRRR